MTLPYTPIKYNLTLDLGPPRDEHIGQSNCSKYKWHQYRLNGGLKFHVCYAVYSQTTKSVVYLCGICLSVVLLTRVEVLLNEDENRELHRRCIEQYDHLRDEFERYKLRAQSVLKNKSSATQKVYLDLIICLVPSPETLHSMLQVAAVVNI